MSIRSRGQVSDIVPVLGSSSEGTRLGSTNPNRIAHTDSTTNSRYASYASPTPGHRAALTSTNPSTSIVGPPTVSILEQSLAQVRGQVNVDAYLGLFSEMVSYCRDRVESVMGLQDKLNELGYHIGRRALDLIVARERITRRETKILSILNFIVIRLWTFLYGKQADSLKKVRDSETEYYIEENDPLVNKYISVPLDYGHFNCASFTAGIISGVLNGSGFEAQVTAKILAPTTNTTNSSNNVNSNEEYSDGHQFNSSSSSSTQHSPMTIYYIKFERSVLEREKKVA